MKTVAVALVLVGFIAGCARHESSTERLSGLIYDEGRV